MADNVLIKVFCIVLGESVPFGVIVPKTAIVDDLKDLIKAKKQPEFDSFAADKLNLYKVEIPDDDNLFSNVEMEMAKSQTALRATKELADVFMDDLKKNSVHIVVQVPNATVRTPENRAAPLPMQITPPKQHPSPAPDRPESAARKLEGFLGRLRPSIREFFERDVAKYRPPDFVTPEVKQFYSKLAIPVNLYAPNLLLHDLGTSCNEPVNHLFRYTPPEFQILCNTSGSGKTRLLLEGLTKHWGFYFVAAVGGDGFGSKDLQLTIDCMEHVSGWDKDIFAKPTVEEVQEASKSNHDIASHRLEKVLFARRAIFQTFIEEAKAHHRGDWIAKTKFDWLLYQIHASRAFPRGDPFVLFMDECLLGVNLESLRQLSPMRPTDCLGPDFDIRREHFWYILDEVQVVGKRYSRCFADDAGKLHRPVLRPLIKVLGAGINTRVIISGTGFNLKDCEQVLASGIGKPSKWGVEHVTGDFVDQDTQLKYIARYLPPSFLNSKSGKVFQSRVYEWLRGRHRFTASFIEQLLQGPWKNDGPAAPHKLLDAYVHRLTEFCPVDGPKNLMDREPEVPALTIDSFMWEKLDQDDRTSKALEKSIYHQLLRGQYPVTHDNKDLVEYGIARFIRENGQVKVVVQEPLALVGVVRYFESRNRTLLDSVWRDIAANQGLGFEEVTLYALTKLLQGGRPLDEIFEFHGDPPWYAGSKAQIVTRESSGAWVKFDSIDGAPMLPESVVACYAPTPDAVQEWLQNGQAGWCIPHVDMGPDLMARGRLDNGAILLIVVQAKCHLHGNADSMKASETASAINSVLPSQWFSKKGIPARDISKLYSLINAGKPASAELPYTMLGVIAAYPLRANLKSSSRYVADALGRANNAPLAVLSHSALSSALYTNPAGSAIIHTLEKSLKRARSPSEEDGQRNKKPKTA